MMGLVRGTRGGGDVQSSLLLTFFFTTAVLLQPVNAQVWWADFVETSIIVTEGTDLTAIIDVVRSGFMTDTVYVPSEFNFEQMSYTVTEGINVTVDVGVVRTNPNGSTVVEVVSSDGTAVDGIDYHAINVTVGFQGFNPRASVNVSVIDNNLVQDTSCFSLSLNLLDDLGGVLVLGKNTATEICIIDNDVDKLNFKQTSYTVTEGMNLTAVVVRTNPNGFTAVDVVSFDGTAVGGLDYQSINTTLGFVTGSDRLAVNVSITDNAVAQLPRCFNLSLENPVPSGACLGENSTAEICILDDDDTEAPNVTCPSNISRNTDSGVASAVVTWLMPPSASDNVDSLDSDGISCEDTAGKVVMSGGTYGVGMTTVRCRISDSALNEGSCQFNITVVDTEAPNVTCPSSIPSMPTASGVANAVVTWSPMPSAADNVDALNSSSVTCEDGAGNTVMSGGTYALGTTTVTCNATDISLNEGSCQFTITVSAADNVDALNSSSVTCEDGAGNTVMSGGTYALGTTTVTCNATDTALNEGSCQFTVTVVDMEAPNVTCPSSIPSMPTASGVANAVVTWSPMPSAADNVDALNSSSVTCEDGAGNAVISGGMYGVGTTTVTCSATDTALNEGSCQFTITIVACALSDSSCVNGGALDDEACECVCPLAYSGPTCIVENPCLTNQGDLCSDTTSGQFCLPTLNADGFMCPCRISDGFFMMSGMCECFPFLTIVIRATSEVYREFYMNPTSTAFRNQIAILEELVLDLLRADPATSRILSVNGIAIESGSLLVTMALQFSGNESAPRQDVMRVLSSTTSLTDGITTITLDPSAVIVYDTGTDCAPNYCLNGGTCVKSGYYFTQITYSCRCGTSFTGQRCETVIPAVIASTVIPSTTAFPDGGLSTLAIILIAVGGIMLITVAGLLLCICLLQQYRHRTGLAHRHPQRKPHSSRHSYANYDHNRVLNDNGTSALREEDRRMNDLMNVVSHSPYLQRGLSSRHDFIRPYMVTGQEALYYQTPMVGGVAGRVVRNPNIYY